MRVLACSDWHTDAITAGVDRAEDMAVAIGETVEAAVRRQADLYLFLGDLCDPDGVRSHRAAALGVLTAVKLQHYGISSRWLVGNHDVIEDGSGSHTLAGIEALAFGQRARREATTQVYAAPCVESFMGPDGRVIDLIALPFTPRSHAYDPMKFIEELPANVGVGTRVIVVGHLNIEGIGPGSETLDMPRGRDVFWPVESIRKRWPEALMLAGHYHTRQVFDGIVVVGSLERLTFGEEKNEPGYVIVDI